MCFVLFGWAVEKGGMPTAKYPKIFPLKLLRKLAYRVGFQSECDIAREHKGLLIGECSKEGVLQIG